MWALSLFSIWAYISIYAYIYIFMLNKPIRPAKMNIYSQIEPSIFRLSSPKTGRINTCIYSIVCMHTYIKIYLLLSNSMGLLYICIYAESNVHWWVQRQRLSEHRRTRLQCASIMFIPNARITAHMLYSLIYTHRNALLLLVNCICK